MKLIIWNIQWALGMDGRVDPSRVVRHAREMGDFDVLCCRRLRTDGGVDEEDHPRLHGLAHLEGALLEAEAFQLHEVAAGHLGQDVEGRYGRG